MKMDAYILDSLTQMELYLSGGVIFALIIAVIFIVFYKRTQSQCRDLQGKNALLEQRISYEQRNVQEKTALIASLEAKMQESFQAIATKALAQNHESLLGVAKVTFEQMQNSSKTDFDHRHKAIHNMVDPISKALGQVDEKLQSLEKERVHAYVDLKRQVQDLLVTQKDLRLETASLVKALRAPHSRGQWGEIQLKRVVELAGMMNHCDFYQQQSTSDNKLRPDMIVRLPGKKQIVVDAKTSLSAYLDALEAQNEDQRQQFLAQHAQQIRTHIKQLSQKKYWDQFDDTPEFVVMFLPSESLFSAALEQDPSLIEYGVDERVILATPTTLIALLKAVAFGWRQESLTEAAQHVSDLGKELYKRISDMNNHFSKMGRLLGQSVDAYNLTVGTMERRVLVTARKMKDTASLSHDDIPISKELDTTPRRLQSLEMMGDSDHNEKDS